MIIGAISWLIFHYLLVSVSCSSARVKPGHVLSVQEHPMDQGKVSALKCVAGVLVGRQSGHRSWWVGGVAQGERCVAGVAGVCCKVCCRGWSTVKRYVARVAGPCMMVSCKGWRSC